MKPLLLQPAMFVFYRVGANTVPAVLIEPAGDGCWMARDARHTRSLVYLVEEQIVSTLIDR